jgi:hypothetical protein
MPDIAPLLIAILSLVATVTLGVALYGRRDLSSPRCRRCKADVREKAMDGSFTCACGAGLLKRRAVTFPYRLLRRWAAVGLAFALAAIVLGVVETRVLSIGLGWRAVQPDWYFRWAWPYGDDQGFDHEVLAWHVRNLTSRAEARELLDAVIKKPLPRAVKAEDAFASLLAKASPDGERAARTGEFIVAGLTLDVSRDGRSLSLHWPGPGGPFSRGFAVRVERITRGGDPVRFVRASAHVAGINESWRLLGDGDLIAHLEDGDAYLPAGEIIVYGDLVCPPAGLTLATLEEDPIIVLEDDPDRWGLDLVRCRFAISTAATPTTNAGGGASAAAWNPAVATALEPFLGGAEGFVRRPALAAAQPVACAALGLLVGLVTLAGIVAVRLVAVSPWALDVAGCARCRSHVRGAGTTLPHRCPECGVEVTASGVRYALRQVVWPLVVAGGLLVAIVVLASTAFVGPRVVSKMVDRQTAWASDPVEDAGWSGERLLAGDRAMGRDLRMRYLGAYQESLDTSLALARAIAGGWRESESARTAEGRPPRESERVAWMYAVARALSNRFTPADPVRDAELVATFEAMRDEWRLPGVALPRAVRVGERIKPRLRMPFALWIVHIELRDCRNMRVAQDWTSNLKSPLPIAARVGGVHCDMEWTLGQGLDADALASHCGTIRGNVHVLPNDGPVTVVTDPALNPLDGGATVTLEIRETGERDLVTITADDAAVGVALAGSWRLGDASGGTPPRVLTRQSGGPWVGLVSVAAWTGDARAGAFDERPDEVVATFVPDPDAGPIELGASGTVTILWGSETTVRFRRVPQREFDMVARYELVP